MAEVVERWKHADGALRDWLRRQGRPAVEATCPVDDWTFHPLYTGGGCPLCGWRPPGVEVSEPLWMRIDWFALLTIAMFVASVAMGIVVVLAFLYA